jgi:hypothetical protein
MSEHIEVEAGDVLLTVGTTRRNDVIYGYF